MIAVAVLTALAVFTSVESATTNCDQLKTCLEGVARKQGCACPRDGQQILDWYNQCIQQRGVRDRCPSNKANFVCYNYESQTCNSDVENCYYQYHDDFTSAEENAHTQCAQMSKK